MSKSMQQNIFNSLVRLIRSKRLSFFHCILLDTLMSDLQIVVIFVAF